MKVKIGYKWYSSDDQAICIELSKHDRENIVNMSPDSCIYAVFPDDSEMTIEEMLDWMGSKASKDGGD